MTALVIKATLAILIALAMVMTARRSQASLRHLILAAMFAFLVLMPIVQTIAPREIDEPRAVGSWRTAVLPTPTPTQIATPTSSSASSTANWQPFDYAQGWPPTANWGKVASVTYVSVAALLMGWLLLGVWRLRRIADGGEVWLDGTARMNEIAHDARIRRSALVVLSHDTAVPMTFGFRRSTIVLPYAAREWSSDELTRALRHELEHVRREDWLLQLVARVACAIYWPHPLVWTAWRRFCLEAERACDDAVIGTSAPEAYAGQLVSLARNLRRFNTVPALGMASRSKLAVRVAAILDQRQRRGPHGSFAAVCVLALLLALLVGLAPAKLIAAAADFESSMSIDPDPEYQFNVEPAEYSETNAEVVEVAESDHDSRDDDEHMELGELMVLFGLHGDNRKLQKMLDDGVDVNLVKDGDGTALIGAASGGHFDTVRFLVNRGADPNLPSLGDGNPLIAAAANGHAKIVELLLHEGARIDEVVPGDENALMNAAANGHEEVVRVLLRHGADVNARAYEDGVLRTPLRLARKHGNTNIVELLEDAGARE